MKPLFIDDRADVRRLAAAIVKRELVRWSDRDLLYRLADAEHRELRGAAAELLLSIGEAEADPAVTPPIEWLTSAGVFALAESTHKATRELALALVRRHYERLGGAEKLAWLMEAPDREVRLAAVRLLFEKHRPLPPADAWRKKHPEAPKNADRFVSLAALQQFLRTVLFGLPPGRMERRELDQMPERNLSASVAKRRLIEVVRDLAIERADFVPVALGVLAEFSSSTAKGEWQSCIAAMERIRAVHERSEARA